MHVTQIIRLQVLEIGQKFELNTTQLQDLKSGGQCVATNTIKFRNRSTHLH